MWRGDGKARVNEATGYQILYQARIGGRTTYGRRVLVVPDVENAPPPRAGMDLDLRAARSPAVPNVDAVGRNGALKLPLTLLPLRHGAAVTAEITFDHFAAVDIRVGRIVEVEDFPEARKPAWKLRDRLRARAGREALVGADHQYPREELEGRLVVAVVNFPPRQIGPVRSEVLVLGTYSEEGVLLLSPEPGAVPGERVG